LENLGNDNGYDPKANMSMLPKRLQIPPLLIPDYSIDSTEGKFELNQKTLCACKLPCYYYNNPIGYEGEIFKEFLGEKVN